MKMNAKDILTPTVSLFIICLVATLLLAVVNNVTYAKIQEQTAKAEAEARVAVLPDAKDFKEVKKGGNVDYYEGVDTNGETVGYVFNTVGESKGYGGAVSVTVGITADGKITGIDAGLMQLQRAAQHPVAGAHAVDLVFHNILNAAAQQQIDLVKIVVVQFHLVHVGGTVAVHFIIRLDHALPLGIGVKTGRHGTPPYAIFSYPYVTAIFAIYQAIVVIFLRKIACYTEITKGAVTVRCQTLQKHLLRITKRSKPLCR